MQDALFGEAYGGGRAALSPVAFLRAWWHSAGGHLEGYQQQDAHEFYLNALSGLVSAGSFCVCVCAWFCVSLMCLSFVCVSAVQGGQNRVVCHLSGYQQQGAHECYLNALSGLVSFWARTSGPSIYGTSEANFHTLKGCVTLGGSASTSSCGLSDTTIASGSAITILKYEGAPRWRRGRQHLWMLGRRARTSP